MFPGHTQILEPRVLCAAHLLGTYTFHPSVNAPVGHDVAIQPDGKVVAVGTTSRATTDALIVRYDTNGNPDNSFGIAGLTTIDTGGNDLACSMAFQPDGKIVVAGEPPAAGASSSSWPD